MSWTRSDTAAHTRPSSDREYVVFLIAAANQQHGVEDWLMHGYAILTEASEEQWTFLIERMKNTWQQLRFDHPGIAAEISKDGRTWTYRPCQRHEDVNRWVQTSFEFDHDANMTNEIYGRLGRKPSCSVYVAPRARSVTLCVPHYHSDARGVLFLLGRLLELVQREPFDTELLFSGEESSRLPVSLDYAAKLSTQAPAECAAEVDPTARSLLMLDSIKGLKVQGNLARPPKKSQLENLTLAAPQTKVIIDACKKSGLSVTAAFHAASCLANLNAAERGTEQGSYSVIVRRDVRSRLPEPWCHTNHSADSFTVSSTVQPLDLAKPLVELAKDIQKHNDLGFSAEAFHKLDGAVAVRILDIILSGVLANTPPFLEIQFSSIGVVDSLSQSDPALAQTALLRLQRLEFGLATCTPSVSAMWLYTLRDEINLSVVYNMAYRSREAVVRHMESTLQLVEQALL